MSKTSDTGDDSAGMPPAEDPHMFGKSIMSSSGKSRVLRLHGGQWLAIAVIVAVVCASLWRFHVDSLPPVHSTAKVTTSSEDENIFNRQPGGQVVQMLDKPSFGRSMSLVSFGLACGA